LISDSSFTRVRGFDIRLLTPDRAASHEDIDGTSLRNGIIVLVAVNTLRGTGLPNRRHRQRVSVLTQGHNEAKFVALSRIGGFDIRLLAPSIVSANEDIHSARAIKRIVVLVAVDALGVAALERSAD